MLAHKLLKRATKTANSRGNESRIAKQDSKIFPRIVETANVKPANGEGYLYTSYADFWHVEVLSSDLRGKCRLESIYTLTKIFVHYVISHTDSLLKFRNLKFVLKFILKYELKYEL